MALYIQKFPKDLHKDLKIIALRKGVDLKDLIAQILREWEGYERRKAKNEKDNS